MPADPARRSLRRPAAALTRRLAALALAGLALAACADGRPGPAAQGCDTRFAVENHSSRTVEQLYFSHGSVTRWGPDQLGREVLRPGQRKLFAAAYGGLYDFRVVWAGGRVAELRRVNVCRAGLVVVSDRGLDAR